MIRYMPHLVSFLVGFSSLGMEILWFRLMGFAGGGSPKTFAYVLAIFLFGIALGAHAGKKCCEMRDNLWHLLTYILLASVVTNVVAIALAALAFSAPQDGYAWNVASIGILLSAAGMAVVFPIVHHLSNYEQQSGMGRAISLVYCANIVGAALGPVFVCFVLLRHLSTQQSIIIIQLILCIAALCSFVVAGSAKEFRNKMRVGVALTLIVVFCSASLGGKEVLLSHIASKFEGAAPSKIIETSRGIVSAYENKAHGDAILGGNIYDGRANIDPVINSNFIDRILITSTLVEHPRRVLMIGLSVGSWLALVTAFPGVETIDVVEINDGYLKLIRDYPAQEAAIHDPRVRLYIEDGVRWLRDHNDAPYDLVIMNTTFHWRSYTSNLLSYEMMEMLRAHMAQHAVLTFNTTDSIDAFATAKKVFPHSYMRSNFVISSQEDFKSRFDKEKAKQKLLSLTLDGKPLYYDGAEGAVKHAVDMPMVTLEEKERLLGRPAEIITWDNMLTEYKYGQ